MAEDFVKRKQVSIALACRMFMVSQRCYRYKPKLSDENALIADWLIGLTQEHKRWGFGLCFSYLRNVKGFGWNHKRVYRIYCELGLNLRIKPRRRLKRERPDNELKASGRPNTMAEQDRIAMQALMAGGANPAEAAMLTGLSRANLAGQGVTSPTKIPWH